MHNILIVSCVFPPEPIVSAEISYSLTEEISKNNKVIVVCPPASRPLGFNFANRIELKFSNSNNVSFNRVNSFVYSKSNPIGRLLEGLSFGFHSYRFIRKNRQNISTVYMNTWPLFGQLGVALACTRSKIKYLVHVQDIYPESLVNKLPRFLSNLLMVLLMPIEKFVLRNASKIIVISKYMQFQILSRGKIQDDKIIIVNNWQDDKVFDNMFESEIENKDLTFMYLGNIGPVANIPLVIQAFSDSKINAKLIIAGSGSKKSDCENLVRLLDLNNVVFIDVPAGAVPETQSKADILILPTIKNGAKSSIPSKLPAYMFSKKPILAILDKDTDTYDAIIESNCGWVVEPEHKNEIIEQFKFIANVPKADLVKMGINGYRYAKENFSKEKNLNRLSNIILNR